MLLRLLAVFLLGSFCNAATKDGKLIRSTIDGIHVHMVFDEDLPANKLYNISYHRWVAKRYDYIWGTVDLGAVGHQHFGTGMCYDVLQAWDTMDNRTIDYWKQSHPDWIMYKDDKKTPAWLTDGGYQATQQTPLDISNAEYLDNFLGEWIPEAEASNCDTFCVDRLSFRNLEGRVGHFSKSGDWVQLYTGKEEDDKYFQDVVTWYKKAKEKLRAQPKVKYIIAAFGFSPTGQKSNFLQILPELDGVFDESAYSNKGDPRVKGDDDTIYDEFSDMVHRVNMAKGIQKSGRVYLQNHYFPKVGPEEEQFAAASYLLSKDDQSTMWVGTTDDEGKDIWRNIYKTDIGRPCGDHTVRGKVFRRHYSNGIVVVNGDNKKSQDFKFGKDDLPLTDAVGGGKADEKITLQKHTGRIFLYDTKDKNGCKANK